MKKKLFKNYNFSFDKNETKLINNFCKQAISQMGHDSRFAPVMRAYNSIMDKLAENHFEVKFTKDEVRHLTLQMKENSKAIKEKADKSWFLMRWMYNSMYKQYNSILNNHFSEF